MNNWISACYNRLHLDRDNDLEGFYDGSDMIAWGMFFKMFIEGLHCSDEAVNDDNVDIAHQMLDLLIEYIEPHVDAVTESEAWTVLPKAIYALHQEIKEYEKRKSAEKQAAA